jgi:hypothetical protein
MQIILTEAQIKKLQEQTQFEIFAEKRMGGAEKIAKNAKQKGGPAMLTFHHFDVKLPYYKKAKEGKFDLEKTKKEYKQYIDELVQASDNVNMTQTRFQKLLGLLEVMGELIIKYK